MICASTRRGATLRGTRPPAPLATGWSASRRVRACVWVCAGRSQVVRLIHSKVKGAQVLYFRALAAALTPGVAGGPPPSPGLRASSSGSGGGGDGGMHNRMGGGSGGGGAALMELVGELRALSEESVSVVFATRRARPVYRAVNTGCASEAGYDTDSFAQAAAPPSQQVLPRRRWLRHLAPYLELHDVGALARCCRRTALVVRTDRGLWLRGVVRGAGVTGSRAGRERMWNWLVRCPPAWCAVAAAAAAAASAAAAGAGAAATGGSGRREAVILQPFAEALAAGLGAAGLGAAGAGGGDGGMNGRIDGGGGGSDSGAPQWLTDLEQDVLRTFAPGKTFGERRGARGGGGRHRSSSVGGGFAAAAALRRLSVEGAGAAPRDAPRDASRDFGGWEEVEMKLAVPVSAAEVEVGISAAMGRDIEDAAEADEASAIEGGGGGARVGGGAGADVEGAGAAGAEALRAASPVGRGSARESGVSVCGRSDEAVEEHRTALRGVLIAHAAHDGRMHYMQVSGVRACVGGGGEPLTTAHPGHEFHSGSAPARVRRLGRARVRPAVSADGVASRSNVCARPSPPWVRAAVCALCRAAHTHCLSLARAVARAAGCASINWSASCHGGCHGCMRT